MGFEGALVCLAFTVTVSIFLFGFASSVSFVQHAHQLSVMLPRSLPQFPSAADRSRETGYNGLIGAASSSVQRSRGSDVAPPAKRLVKSQNQQSEVGRSSKRQIPGGFSGLPTLEDLKNLPIDLDFANAPGLGECIGASCEECLALSATCSWCDSGSLLGFSSGSCTVGTSCSNVLINPLDDVSNCPSTELTGTAKGTQSFLKDTPRYTFFSSSFSLTPIPGGFCSPNPSTGECNWLAYAEGAALVPGLAFVLAFLTFFCCGFFWCFRCCGCFGGCHRSFGYCPASGRRQKGVPADAYPKREVWVVRIGIVAMSIVMFILFIVAAVGNSNITNDTTNFLTGLINTVDSLLGEGRVVIEKFKDISGAGTELLGSSGGLGGGGLTDLFGGGGGGGAGGGLGGLFGGKKRTDQDLSDTLSQAQQMEINQLLSQQRQQHENNDKKNPSSGQQQRQQRVLGNHGKRQLDFLNTLGLDLSMFNFDFSMFNLDGFGFGGGDGSGGGQMKSFEEMLDSIIEMGDQLIGLAEGVKSVIHGLNKTRENVLLALLAATAVITLFGVCGAVFSLPKLALLLAILGFIAFGFCWLVFGLHWAVEVALVDACAYLADAKASMDTSNPAFELINDCPGLTGIDQAVQTVDNAVEDLFGLVCGGVTTLCEQEIPCLTNSTLTCKVARCPLPASQCNSSTLLQFLGTTIEDVCVFPGFVPGGTFPAGFTLPGGITIPEGFSLPASFPPGYTLPGGFTIPEGFVFDGTLPAGFTLPGGVTVPGGATVPAGFTTPAGFTLPPGTTTTVAGGDTTTTMAGGDTTTTVTGGDTTTTVVGGDTTTTTAAAAAAVTTTSATANPGTTTTAAAAGTTTTAAGTTTTAAGTMRKRDWGGDGGVAVEAEGPADVGDESEDFGRPAKNNDGGSDGFKRQLRGRSSVEFAELRQQLVSAYSSYFQRAAEALVQYELEQQQQRQTRAKADAEKKRQNLPFDPSSLTIPFCQQPVSGCGLDLDFDLPFLNCDIETRNITECVDNCWMEELRNATKLFADGVPLIYAFNSLWIQNVRPLMSCDRILDVVRAVEDFVCIRLVNSFSTLAVAAALMALFYIPTIVLALLGSKRFTNSFKGVANQAVESGMLPRSFSVGIHVSGGGLEGSSSSRRHHRKSHHQGAVDGPLSPRRRQHSHDRISPRSPRSPRGGTMGSRSRNRPLRTISMEPDTELQDIEMLSDDDEHGYATGEAWLARD